MLTQADKDAIAAIVREREQLNDVEFAEALKNLIEGARMDQQEQDLKTAIEAPLKRP